MKDRRRIDPPALFGSRHPGLFFFFPPFRSFRQKAKQAIINRTARGGKNERKKPVELQIWMVFLIPFTCEDQEAHLTRGGLQPALKRSDNYSVVSLN